MRLLLKNAERLCFGPIRLHSSFSLVDFEEMNFIFQIMPLMPAHRGNYSLEFLVKKRQFCFLLNVKSCSHGHQESVEILPIYYLLVIKPH